MASGFPGGAGADFYRRTGVGSAAINNNHPVQFRSQLGGILVDPSSPIVPRRTDMAMKRSLAELQQQHQQDLGGFPRSVKQRNSHHHTSPISTLSPVDFSTIISPGMSPALASSPNLSGTYSHGVPLLTTYNNQTQVLYGNQSSSGLTSSGFVQNRAMDLESEPESEKKMRNRLQELEKQLLDDDHEENEDEASVITGSEWGETMQNLITLKEEPHSPSPTTSLSSSSSSSSSSPSSFSNGSSKQSLMEAALAISEEKFESATEKLARLIKFSNTRGDPEQRLTAYMISALQSRMKNPATAPEVHHNEDTMATQMLYEVSPCFKLGFMAANLAILEAIRDEPNNNIHVVDFDIGFGNRYITLVHALAERKSGQIPTVVKITTVTDPTNNNEERLRKVGGKLRTLAERVGVGLKFNVVNRKFSDLSRDSLGCNADEALAVNFAFQLYKMPDESVSTENPRDALLRLVKGLSPRVVTLVEQEMNANTAPFVARVSELCSYYGALFNSFDSSMNRELSGRVRVEEFLGRKATNSVACEGRERVERCEVFGKWRARMGMAGFQPKPMSQQIAESARAKLNNSGFTVKEENGGICFGWMGRVLTVASAWR